MLLKKEVVERPELQAILKVVNIDSAEKERKPARPAEGHNETTRHRQEHPGESRQLSQQRESKMMRQMKGDVSYLAASWMHKMS